MELQFVYVVFDVRQSVEAHLRHHTANEAFIVDAYHWRWVKNVTPPTMKVLAIVPTLDSGGDTYLAVFCEIAE